MPFAQQNRLGVVGNLLAGGSDNAGFPNGRRPKDDIVDIALVAMMGGLCMANGTTDALGFGAACNPAAVPLKDTAFKLHDGVDQAVVPLLPGVPLPQHADPGRTVKEQAVTIRSRSLVAGAAALAISLALAAMRRWRQRRSRAAGCDRRSAGLGAGLDRRAGRMERKALPASDMAEPLDLKKANPPVSDTEEPQSL